MKIADTPPALCTACYGQYPQRIHVDFEASYDGPVIEGGVMGEDGKVLSRLPVAIDELIICDDCLKTAARMLGLDEEHADRLKRAEEERDNLRERVLGLADYIKKLESAVAARPAPQRKKPTAVAA